MTRASIALFLGVTSVKRPSFQVHHRVPSISFDEEVPVTVSDEDWPGEKSLFNPLGPPEALASLKIGSTLSLPRFPFDSTIDKGAVTVQRLSRDPDIFQAKNVLSQELISSLKFSAEEQGLKIAGTKNSSKNSVRKNSYLTWLDQDDYYISGDTKNLLEKLQVFAGTSFMHESLLPRSDYFHYESLQVAKYDTGGKFDLHHDDFSRFLTVLYYLNGVGGTYFPYAQTTEEKRLVKIDGSIIEPGRNGLLIVGCEDASHYLTNEAPKKDICSSSIAYIEPGDSVFFYSYLPGEKNNKTIHSSLPVPCEKWIATSWVRSEKLTSQFGYMHASQIQSDFFPPSL